jgi:hypothetical protein
VARIATSSAIVVLLKLIEADVRAAAEAAGSNAATGSKICAASCRRS